jgi:uncharacterized protein YdeI (YjbR/CyaY-like superfamily)
LSLTFRGCGEDEMGISQTLYVTSRVEWRTWLAKHHSSQSEVWLVYYKKHTGVPRIPYDDAVEEALCFGWIDSIVKRIDDAKFAQKFTPRKDRTKWSALNKKRVRKLIKEGRMTEVGLAKVDFAALDEEPQANPARRKLPLPRFVKQALMANPKAWEHFQNLAPSYRRHYIGWIMHAKKEETRLRRLKEAIALLEQNQKLGLK